MTIESNRLSPNYIIVEIINVKDELTVDQLKLITSVLNQGGVIVYPTDTSYGMGADWQNNKALNKIFKIKGRNKDKNLPVIVSSKKMAKEYVVWNKAAEKLANEFWPGALTIVLRIKSYELRIKGSDNTLGVRIPDNKIARQIVKALKRPLVSTSANIADYPSAYSLNEFQEQFKNKKILPDIFVNAGSLKIKPASTVVDLSSSQIIIKRESAVLAKNIFKLINGSSRVV